MNVFAVNLKSLITEKKITLEELAKYLGLTRQAISNYTLGKTTPNFDILIKIAQYFNVSTDFLLTGLDSCDKKKHNELKLSGNAIRLLKNCEPRIFCLIDKLLSDTKFYSTFTDVFDVMKTNNNSVIYLITHLHANNGILASEKETIYEGLLSFAIEHTNHIMSKYFFDFFAENTSYHEAVKLVNDLKNDTSKNQSNQRP